MNIDFRQLSQDALHNLIESYILREGTDYGEQEFSLSDKVNQVMQQLREGQISVVFDPENESCSLQSKEG